jgi:glutaredoxin-like protein
MEKLITEEIASQVIELFENLDGAVEILFFKKSSGCQNCEEIEQLINEVTELSPLLSYQVLDVAVDKATAELYNVSEAPVLVIAAREGDELIDYGVRMLGAPAGHEFTSLIHDLLYVSRRSTDLTSETRAYLEGLTEPVLLQVFVTPTCPYCPQAVLLAHQMAIESSFVQAEMVESTEFNDLAIEFNVRGVPQTTINSGMATVVGAVPEHSLLQQIEQALLKQTN